MKFNKLIEQYLEEAKIRNRTIAVVPGAFRPPHKGHFDMIKKYAKEADKVIVLISPDNKSAISKRTTPAGKYISAEMSKQIWDLYISAAALGNKVSTSITPSPSPVAAAFDFVENKDNDPQKAQPGEHVLLGVSTKGGDERRFELGAQKYAREGVTVEAKPFIAPTEMSATDFRKQIDNAIEFQNPKPILKFLPKESQRFADNIVKILSE